jgi:hypothetical protein
MDDPEDAESLLEFTRQLTRNYGIRFGFYRRYDASDEFVYCLTVGSYLFLSNDPSAELN